MRELQALIENKSKNLNVILTGYISNSDVKQLYMMNDFDLFVNMSLSEGIPVSIMEAISFGIPIIATNVGGNAEIVNDETQYHHCQQSHHEDTGVFDGNEDGKQSQKNTNGVHDEYGLFLTETMVDEFMVQMPLSACMMG